MTGRDAGTQPDGGTAPQDAGTAPEDGGTAPQDTGTSQQDSGTSPPDTGTPPPDSGTPAPPDTGAQQDTGTAPPDTGPADAGVCETTLARVTVARPQGVTATPGAANEWRVELAPGDFELSVVAEDCGGDTVTLSAGAPLQETLQNGMLAPGALAGTIPGATQVTGAPLVLSGMATGAGRVTWQLTAAGTVPATPVIGRLIVTFDTPPVIAVPSPPALEAGVPFMFDLSASDADAGDQIAITLAERAGSPVASTAAAVTTPAALPFSFPRGASPRTVTVAGTGRRAGRLDLRLTATDLLGRAATPVDFSVDIAAGQAVRLTPRVARGARGSRVPIGVVVADQYGNPVSGHAVQFAAGAGRRSGTSVSPSSAVTSSAGVASAMVTLGRKRGQQTINATSGGLSAVVRVKTPTFDFDGDLIDDIAVGATEHAYVFLGARTLTSGQLAVADAARDHVFPSVTTGLCAIAGQAGDLDGDGRDDLGVLCGAAAYVFLGTQQRGTAPAAVAELTITGGFHPTAPPLRLSGAGDVNGDGAEDLFLGSPEGSNGGEAYLFLTDPANRLVAGQQRTRSANQAQVRFYPVNGGGSSRLADGMGGGGDYNADGIGDLLLGWPGAGDCCSGQVFDQGAVHVFFGRRTWQATQGLADVYIHFETGEATAQALGGPGGSTIRGYAADLGDFDGDGFDDVISGAAGLQVGPTRPGAAFISFGGAGGLGNEISCAHPDPAPADWGTWVASAGDVDGDGFDDAVVGGLRGSGAYVILGNAQRSCRAVVIGACGAGCGNNSFAGDFDGDGFSDLALANPVGAGVYVVRGGARFATGATIPMPQGADVRIEGLAGFGRTVSAANYFR